MRKRKEKQKGRKRKERRNKEKRIRREKREENEKGGKGKEGFSGFRAVDVRQFEYKRWCTQWDLRVDTKKLEFRQTPRDWIFSYLVYF